MEANKVLEKWFPTPQGHEDTKAIIIAMEEYAKKYQQAKTLLEQIIMDHALGTEMSVMFYREIKSFLDGSK